MTNHQPDDGGQIVLHGDCLDMLRTLPDESIAAIITDPPYGLSNTRPGDEALEIVQAVMHLQPPCDDSTLNSKLTKSERVIIAKIAVQRILERIPTPYQ